MLSHICDDFSHSELAVKGGALQLIVCRPQAELVNARLHIHISGKARRARVHR